MKYRLNKKFLLEYDNNAVDKKYKQSNYEAWLTLVVYVFYSIWWWFFAYGIGDDDALTYTYVMGFPLWFFYGCLIGFLVLCCVLWFIIHQFFKEVSLNVPFQAVDAIDINSLQLQDECHPELL